MSSSSSEPEFADRVALITGAGSGLGAATAHLLAQRGAKVVISDINLAGAERVTAEIIAAGGTATALHHDVTRAASSLRAVEFCVDTYGKLDCAVNNAGVVSNGDLIGDLDPTNWDHDISVDLSGVLYGLRYQIPAILEAGGGAIVNLASVAGHAGVPRNAAYVAAKHGVVGLTKAAALEYSAAGVRVNAVGPGYIRTEGLATLPPDRIDVIAKKHPINRLGEPNEIAEVIAFLLSGRASFVTGAFYLVDGGYAAGWPGALG